MPRYLPRPARVHQTTPSPKLALLAVAFVAFVALTGEQRQYRRMATLQPDYKPAINESSPNNKSAQVQEASPPIQQISLLGERNSGTRWTYE